MGLVLEDQAVFRNNFQMPRAYFIENNVDRLPAERVGVLIQIGNTSMRAGFLAVGQDDIDRGMYGSMAPGEFVRRWLE
jgi:hypothetical protein